ncbi:FAD-dependent oxidoreductase [Ancylobacter oerskovii]|uniref:FAD-dependent oxidoreductase n=1 Tax=Ancylobacter oerskovii TaxID=459519 RepID=A0ABW4Z0D3_9HYPH|nr:FAD-dependent oxidoreductase [Ancylobacter oerskovii]MBS7542967.1 FAD-binding protein [Ancylobacter oerskovii]
MTLHTPASERFDEAFDVLVVGFGFAGGASAIAAHDAGARVLLIEKQPDPGGISICAGGGIRTVVEPEGARTYLRHTVGPDVPDDVLDTVAGGMAELEPYFRGLAKVNGAQIEVHRRVANYPFPGHDAFGTVEVLSIPGFDARTEYPHVRGRLRGPNVFKLVHDNVRARGIEVRLNTAAERLILGPDGGVLGAEIREDGQLKRIAARRGVILASGGFEAAPEIQRKYWQIRPVLPVATRSNTGDGLRMAQAAGADLWHMWHFHGSYGFRHPDPAYPYGLRVKKVPDWTPQLQEPDVRLSWIVLDRQGRRFMNEYQPYLQDTGHRPLDQYDAQTQRFPRIPAFLVVDEEGRKLYPLGQTVLNDRTVEPYEWSDDNLKEVGNGILKRADSVKELAVLIGADPAAVAESLARWNAAVEDGRDGDHNRPAGTLFPVKNPPFYVGELWPVVSNTQGGPAHDARQRVVTPHGTPIPRLYEAGEIGSIWGFLYLGAGNLAECFVTGRIAGREAASERPWASSPELTTA